MREKIISAHHLHKHYELEGKKIEVLRDVSVDIFNGEFLSIVGRSGSGKTTLLNILSTLVRPDKGDLFYNDNNLSLLPHAELNHLRKTDFAVIFQFHHLLPYLTVMQNTLLPFMGTLAPVSGDMVKRAEECLVRMGLADKKNRLPGSLSGGEQQRVAIARAMVKSAKILFADEPTGSLDRSNGKEIMKYLKELNEDGLTVIMVTHEPSYADCADKVIELSDGEVLQSGLSKEEFGFHASNGVV